MLRKTAKKSQKTEAKFGLVICLDFLRFLSSVFDPYYEKDLYNVFLIWLLKGLSDNIQNIDFNSFSVY